ELLVRCHLEWLTQEEAAQALGCSRSTVKRRLEQGRDLLRQRLARRGLGLGAGLLAAVLTPAAGAGAVPKELAIATLRAALAGARTSARMGLPFSVFAMFEVDRARR